MPTYASQYYDPVKAHEYYERTKQLKGYEHRYDNTDRSRGGPSEDVNTHNARVTSQISSANSASKAKIDNSTSKISNISAQIKNLRSRLNAMSNAEKKANRPAIQAEIKSLQAQVKAERAAIKQERQANSDAVQRLKQQTKGGSTNGFNQKGKEAAAYIKSQMEDEVKKQNEALDAKYLPKLEALQQRIKGGADNATIKRALQSLYKMLSNEKKKNRKSYRQKYSDEIDKLRSDDSMYIYWDKRNSKK